MCAAPQSPPISSVKNLVLEAEADLL